MRETRSDRRLPVFITLVVLSLLLMTFDLRSDGGGVARVVRDGAGAVFTPLQAAASAVVDPVADAVDGLLRIGSLRAENEALRARLAEAQAELTSTDDLRARLATLERVLDLETPGADLSLTPANVVGRSDNFGDAFRIDKGRNDGVLAGHPVLDDYGQVVGKVVSASAGSAIVAPLTGDVDALTVLVGGRTGSLSARPGSGVLDLEIIDRPVAVEAGTQVVTSQLSSVFPPGLLVGEVIDDAVPTGGVLLARVRPLADLENLRVVSVVAWSAEVATEPDREADSPDGPFIPIPTTAPTDDSGDE